MDYSRDEVVDSQVLKQADVVMLQTLLPEYFSQEVKKANLDYYEPKTLHDSSLSPSIHAIAYADVGNRSKAYQYFKKSMKIDINDHLVDSTDGLHAASLGGIWLALIRGFAGVFVTSGYLKVDPCMPSAWQRMCFYYRYLGNKLEFNITDREIHIRNVEPAVIQGNRTFWIKTSGKIHFFDQELSVPYDEGNDPDLQ